jgi:hypothetical protein
MSEMPNERDDQEPDSAVRRDGLADERDDPQAHPYDERLAEKIAEENAATSLDQPSGDVE